MHTHTQKYVKKTRIACCIEVILRQEKLQGAFSSRRWNGQTDSFCSSPRLVTTEVLFFLLFLTHFIIVDHFVNWVYILVSTWSQTHTLHLKTCYLYIYFIFLFYLFLLLVLFIINLSLFIPTVLHIHFKFNYICL